MRVFFTLATITQLIPIMIGTLNYNFLDKKLKYFYTYLVVAAVFGLSSLIITLIFRKPNIWLLHIFTIVEFLMLSIMFKNWIEDERIKNIIMITIVIFVFGIIMIKTFLEDFNKIDNVSLTLESLMMLIITSMFFINYSLKNIIIDYFDYEFIITVTLMFYFGSNVFVFALSNHFNTWPIHVIIGLICQLIYGFVFLWQRYRVKSAG